MSDDAQRETTLTNDELWGQPVATNNLQPNQYEIAQQPEAVPTLYMRYRDIWDLAESLTAYRDHHRPTGDFLRAVLENDLLTACAHADHINRTRLYRIVQFVYSQLPSPCYGSPEKVNAWLHPTQTK
jgi:hypothetical protein